MFGKTTVQSSRIETDLVGLHHEALAGDARRGLLLVVARVVLLVPEEVLKQLPTVIAM